MLLLDWFIRLKRSIINVLLQIVCFQEVLKMSVTWNILCILSCSVSLTFTTLLKNQVECIFLALLSCQHLYASRWFSRDILSLTKSS